VLLFGQTLPYEPFYFILFYFMSQFETFDTERHNVNYNDSNIF